MASLNSIPVTKKKRTEKFADNNLVTTPPPRQHRYARLPADDLTSLLHVANKYKNNGVGIVTVASGRESNLSNLVNIVITGPQTKATEADNTCIH